MTDIRDLARLDQTLDRFLNEPSEQALDDLRVVWQPQMTPDEFRVWLWTWLHRATSYLEREQI